MDGNYLTMAMCYGVYKLTGRTDEVQTDMQPAVMVLGQGSFDLQFLL